MADSEDEWIRKRAYALWEQEGYPAGKDREHWEQAKLEYATRGPTASVKAPEAVARKKAPAEPKAAKPAAAKAPKAAAKPAAKAAPKAESDKAASKAPVASKAPAAMPAAIKPAKKSSKKVPAGE